MRVHFSSGKNSLKRELEEKGGEKEDDTKKRIKLEVVTPKTKTPKVSLGGGEMVRYRQ